MMKTIPFATKLDDLLDTPNTHMNLSVSQLVEKAVQSR